MTKIVVQSDGRALWPRDPFSEEVIQKMSRADAMAEIRQPRSIKHTRFVHAMLRKVADNHPIYRTIDAVKLQLKLRSHMFKPMVMPNGKVVYVPDSTDFHTMDQSQFVQVWEAWRTIIREQLLPGIDDEGFVREMMETL